MAIASVHSDGIRLQAERVVRKYKELRAATGSSFEPNPEFPVGLFAELVTQIRQLDTLAPAGRGRAEGSARANHRRGSGGKRRRRRAGERRTRRDSRVDRHDARRARRDL